MRGLSVKLLAFAALLLSSTGAQAYQFELPMMCRGLYKNPPKFISHYDYESDFLIVEGKNKKNEPEVVIFEVVEGEKPREVVKFHDWELKKDSKKNLKFKDGHGGWWSRLNPLSGSHFRKELNLNPTSGRYHILSWSYDDDVKTNSTIEFKSCTKVAPSLEL